MEKVLELSDQEFKITMIIKLRALMEKTREHERAEKCKQKGTQSKGNETIKLRSLREVFLKLQRENQPI